MKYLGIDYGSKKIGLATSDDLGIIAYPKEIIPNDAHTLTYIADILRDESIERIVVGESIDMSGAENAIMKDIARFIERLKEVTDVPIDTQQEMFTSAEARKPLGFGGSERRRQANQQGKQKIERNIDDKAAALILQRFLDTQ